MCGNVHLLCFNGYIKKGVELCLDKNNQNYRKQILYENIFFCSITRKGEIVLKVIVLWCYFFYFFLPGYEVVLAMVYLSLAQLSDRHGTAKGNMHTSIILLQDSGGLQQTLERENKIRN